MSTPVIDERAKEVLKSLIRLHIASGEPVGSENLPRALNRSMSPATLRNIISAQSQFETQAVVDTDGDGIGEYGWFTEMAGTAIPRGGVAVLIPPVLSSALGTLGVNAEINRSGFFFQMFLPDVNGAGLTETAGFANPDPNVCETAWICYAWPADRQTTGNRAFVVNQTGDVLQTNNQTAPHDGAISPPASVRLSVFVPGDFCTDRTTAAFPPSVAVPRLGVAPRTTSATCPIVTGCPSL